MKKQILATATALALATGLTTNALAFDHKAGRNGSHVSHLHAGAMHNARARHGNRYAGVRGFESSGPGGWEGDRPHGGFIDLGPLGITAGCGLRCGQGYSVSAWSR